MTPAVLLLVWSMLWLTYPSGTKQETGSRLDRIVERERGVAVRDIVAHLRTKTGEDLESSEAWIQKYGKR